MSNPTELPDLDRGYFKRKLATIVRDLSSYTAPEMARELARLAQVADENEALKEARRAQPEGEAPQAERHPWFCSHCQSGVPLINVTFEQEHDPRAGGCGYRVGDWPAAQQAESGAPHDLTIGEAFKAVGGWMNGGELGYPSFGSMEALRVYTQKMVRASLAAQSQDAPVNSVALNLEAQLRAVVRERDELRAQQAAAPGPQATEAMNLALNALEVATTPLPKDRQTVLAAQAALRAALSSTSAPGTPEAPAESRHPLQPLVEDARGTVRFKANAIIVHLTRDKLNDLASMDFSTEDREQLAQLIGYSLGGFAELSYVTDETYDRAAAQPVVPRAAQLDGGQGEGERHVD